MVGSCFHAVHLNTLTVQIITRQNPDVIIQIHDCDVISVAFLFTQHVYFRSLNFCQIIYFSQDFKTRKNLVHVPHVLAKLQNRKRRVTNKNCTLLI